MERTRRIEKGDLIGLRRGDREYRGHVSGVKVSKDGYRNTTLLDVAIELAEFLEEAHQPELDAAHHGDARRRGPTPRSCSYCAALKRAARVIARESRRRA